MDSSKKAIKGEQIKELFTKFFYKENQLSYQIILQFGMKDAKGIVYNEYDDFSKYKKAIDKLYRAKLNNEEVSIPLAENDLATSPQSANLELRQSSY